MIRAFQWDLARQVERLDVLLELLPKYADWGYQELYLHLEDAVEYPQLPGVARGDAYSYREFTRLVETAQRVGIGVVPIVNLLGHTQYLIKVPEYRDLNELRGPDGAALETGQICPLHPRTLEVAEKLIGDMAPFCTAGKMHVGLDESFHLGKCPSCRKEIKRHGLAYHFAGHVNRLHSLTAAKGLRLGFWADMLNFIPEAIPQLPSDAIAYDWYYYPFSSHPRAELFNFAESDLATPLRARGIEYWGCPMNGAFRYEPLPLFKDRLANVRSWWKRCRQTNAGGMLVTSWEAYRLALETTTVVDAAAASLWQSPIAHDDQTMLRQGVARVFGKDPAARAARILLAADAYPYAGYARWDLNNRWDVSPFLCGSDESKRADNEVRYFGRLERSAEGLPEAITASLAFRAYLSRRDDFVENAARGVWALRRAGTANVREFKAIVKELDRDARRFATALRKGRTAARAMWRCTRDSRRSGQNEQILGRDTERLREWRGWLRACSRVPALALGSTPVCGTWQLFFNVVNFAPALQRVSVEQQEPDGKWKELHARYTIEFQAIAARRTTSITRLYSLPIEDPEKPLRLAVSGLGEVRIERVVLDNRIQVRRLADPRRFTMGRSAPRSGFPDITQRLDERVLRFSVRRSRARKT